MTYKFPHSEILSKVCKASLKHEASLGWASNLSRVTIYFHLKILLHFLSLHLSWPRVWRLPFHCPLSWLLCSSSLGARACGGALCLCGQSLCRALPTAPDCHVPLWATHWWVSRAVSVTCRFIYCAAKDSCVQRVSQHLLGQNSQSQPWAQPRWIQFSRCCWISREGTKNVLTAFGCKALLWISLTYSWTQRPQGLRPWTQQTLLSPTGGEGSAVLSSPWGRHGNHTGLQRVRWPRAQPVLPLLVTGPKYFYDLGELSTWPPLYLLQGIFIV